MARGRIHQGAHDQSAIQDKIDTGAHTGPLVTNSGTADVINPHVGGDYIIKSPSADAMVLAAPTPGADDLLRIAIYSDTLFAHTITTVALFANGTALKSVATFAPFRGAGMTFRAYNGVWQVLYSTGVVFS